MTNSKIIRAWKDEDFRSRLSESERASLPANPAGQIELNDTELDAAAGGTITPIKSMLGGLCSDYIYCGTDFFCPVSFGPLDCITWNGQ